MNDKPSELLSRLLGIRMDYRSDPRAEANLRAFIESSEGAIDYRVAASGAHIVSAGSFSELSDRSEQDALAMLAYRIAGSGERALMLRILDDE